MKLFRYYILFLFILFGVFFSVYAQELSIFPEKDHPDIVIKNVKAIGNVYNDDEYDSVWDKYKSITEDKNNKMTLGDKLASGIMDWNTLLDYVVYLIRFLSQIGLFIGASMIIYAGYQYATDIIGGDASKGASSIKYAIIGVAVIGFSYAFIRILTSAFIE